MKTIFLGDTHGRGLWKDIIRTELPDRIVFIGDYFDSYDKECTTALQIHNVKQIIELKTLTRESGSMEIIMLIGNHDHHYFPEVGYTGTSGYQYGGAPAINQFLDENREHFQMAYQMDNILCTHAGVGYDWLVNQNKYEHGVDPGTISDYINAIWKYKPGAFVFNGRDPYGDSKTQTPIWIRPSSLMAGNKDTYLKDQYIQIVGHTQQDTIDMGKATGGKYYFIDTLGTCQEYLIYEDGVFSKGSMWNNVL
jgi:predicted phosphodiesterase